MRGGGPGWGECCLPTRAGSDLEIRRAAVCQLRTAAVTDGFTQQIASRVPVQLVGSLKNFTVQEWHVRTRTASKKPSRESRSNPTRWKICEMGLVIKEALFLSYCRKIGFYAEQAPQGLTTTHCSLHLNAIVHFPRWRNFRGIHY